MNHITTAYTNKKNYIHAVDDLVVQLQPNSPKLIIFFASPYFEPHLLSKEIQKAFPNATTMGCTTAGELCNDQVLSHSIVAMSIKEEAIGLFKIGILPNISQTDQTRIIFNEFESYFSTSMMRMNPAEHFGLILFDGLQEQEEKILSTIGSLTNIKFIGGSAGDDENYECTYVFYNGIAYTDAALLMVCKPNMDFDYIKTQSFDVLDKTLTCTKSDIATRTVLEFDYKPATKAYSELLGVNESKLQEYFMAYPLSLLIDHEPFVRSPLDMDGTNIHFHSQMQEGITYHLLKSTSIIADTKISIAEKSMQFGEIAGLLNFNCMLRTAELKKLDILEDYGHIFETIPSIGFNTYGETYIGHVNQTSTMLIFGKLKDTD